MTDSRKSAFKSFLLHLHPKMINEQAVSYTRTFGLGGINALLFVILAVTGLLLRFSYVPFSTEAYDSITALQQHSYFGRLIRNIHHWSAVLMVFTVFLHFLRVFYSQSFYGIRTKNWYYGLALFAIVVAFNFTGYLLPWDQLSYWAVSIMTNITEYIPFVGEGLANLLRGGETVNNNTLLNFYTFHTALLPLFLVVFMVIHFWLVRKAGGVTVADKSNQKKLPVNPELIYREIFVALILIALLLLVAIIFDAPLLEKANPLVSPNPSKAPWYFMGLQELLINLHPLLAVTILPLLLLAFLIRLPKISYDADRVGNWFYSENGKKIALISVAFSFVWTFVLILILDSFSHFNEMDIPLIVKTGLIPLLLYGIPVLILVFFIKKRFKATGPEIVISVMSILIASYVLMTLVAYYLRGEGMHLIF